MDEIVSSTELGKVLKITSRRVNQLADENVIFREQNRKFNLADSCENFFAWKFKSDGKIDFNREHALHEKAKREKAELDLKAQKGTLLFTDDVEHFVSGMIITFKARLMSLPTKYAPKILGKKSMPEVVEILKGAVYEVLNELHEIPGSEIEAAADRKETFE